LALDLDPLSLSVNAKFGWLLLWVGEYKLAVEQARATLDLSPDALQGWYVLGQVELARSRPTEALAFFEKARAIAPDDPIAISYVGQALGLAGNRDEARRHLDLLLARAKDQYVIPRSMLWVYIGLGEADRAFALLEGQLELRAVFCG
jgi:tetratricopeptide (TPR) repeat protein